MRLLKRIILPAISFTLAFVMLFSVGACRTNREEKHYYSVVYMVDGEQWAKQTYEEGQLSVDPGDPDKKDYLFKGWFTDAEGNGEEIQFGSPVTQDGTYYAVFQKIGGGGNLPDEPGPDNPGPSTPTGKVWTVTYHTDGGTEIQPEKVEDGKTIKALNPYKAEYDFDGWYTDAAHTQPFAAGTPVTKDLDLYAKWTKKSEGGGSGSEPVTTYTVTFMVDGEVYTTQQVNEGQKAISPEPDTKAGQMFAGWYLNDASSPFDFSTAITANITLYAKYTQLDAAIHSVGAYNESLYVTFAEGAPDKAKAEYKEVSQTEWQTVDAPLVRSVGSGEARVDIVGLKKGSYNVKITTSGGAVLESSSPITVSEYDRSGYAHFKYTNGVGAYNDDGTLKDNAIVIYVTEQNKNTVMDEVCAAESDLTMFNIPYSGHGTDCSSKKASGIGWWLNNNQYTASNAASSKDKTPSNTYDAANGGKLGFKMTTRPIAIRIIGKVTTPEGLTAYDSVEYGGTPGDNGNMARMKNLKNITIEGIGDDAMIFGWGLHFIAGTDAQNGQGTSFEVRNITFSEYTEDAIGMEGQQSGSTITAGVERCWIHNNTFLPGHCANAAESDKKEGDGSCDFKRGQYLTVAYNWFEYCHKTNLVGSSDDSMQFNLTYHHNVWWQCGSRIPLTRQANVHFYNNYVYGDSTETTTPYSWISKPALSYVHSLRANCYIFSEANYYDGCKNVTDKSGGTAKGWNNMYYATFGSNTITNVKTREETVSSNCAYNGTSYGKFDTDPNLFYYDAENHVSKCLLDDAVTARKIDLAQAGANGHGITDTKMNEMTPDGAVTVPETGYDVTLGTNAAGIVFNKGKAKFKGQGITFTLTAEAALTVATSSTGEVAPELISADGYVYAHKFTGTITIVLPAGTYVIAAGQKDKEATITSMKFENTTASSKARVDAAIAAIEDLGVDAELTETYATALKAAQNAYNALTSAEKQTFATEHAELLAKLRKAENDYSVLQITHVRELIEAIGTVNKDSYDALQAAQDAYDGLDSTQKAQLAADKAELDQKWKEYQNFAVQNVIDMIEALSSKVNAADENTPKATLEELINEAERAAAAYDALSDDAEGGQSQQSQVTNYAKLTAAENKLDGLYAFYEFTGALAEFEGHIVTISDAASITALKDIYENKLTATQKAKLTSAQTTLYNKILADLADLQSKAIEVNFEGGVSSDPGFVLGSKHNKRDEDFTAPNGTKLTSAMKLESGTSITFTTSVKMTITMYFTKRSAGSQVKFDGAKYTVENKDGYSVVTLTIEAGTHKIEKEDTNVDIFYLTLLPAA